MSGEPTTRPGWRLEEWLQRRWGTTANEVVGGGVALLVGLGIVLIGLFDDREDAFPAGRLPVFLAGAAFSLAGWSILVQALWRGHRVASILGVLCGLVLLATPASFAVSAVPVRALAWGLASGLSLLGALVIAFGRPGSPQLSKRVRLVAAALLVLLAAAAGLRLLRGDATTPAPAGSAERLPAEQEPPEPGR